MTMRNRVKMSNIQILESRGEEKENVAEKIIGEIMPGTFQNWQKTSGQ